MRRSAAFFPIALALGAMALAPNADAREGPIEIEKCQTISNPGSYKLVNNLTATGDCLLINADFVTVDLAGFAIIGTSAGIAVQFTGPTPQIPRRGIAVRNGTISGFATGVELFRVGGTDGAMVEGLRVFDASAAGIRVRGAIVRGNTVVSCGSAGTGITSNFGSVIGNVVIGCQDGIDAFGGVVSDNTVDSNTGTGIIIDEGTVIGNTATDNHVGISATCPSNVTNNTAVNNSGGNIVLSGNGCINTNNVMP